MKSNNKMVSNDNSEKISKKLLSKKMGDVVEENITKLLNEGYFKSYPTEIVKRTLDKKLRQISDESKSSFEFILNTADEIDDEDAFNDLQNLYLQITEFSKVIKEKIENVLDQCGWYIADVEHHKDIGQYMVYIEPKFPIENSKVDKISKKWIEQYKIFYHVSFKKYEEKILKNGLSPSLSKRREFEHPERVYLFGDKLIAKDFITLHKTDKIKYAKEIGRRKVRNTSKDADEKHQDPSMSNMIGFEVDLFQMMKDGKTINLYHDNRWDKNSPVFFTQNTINPKYLKQFYSPKV